MDKKSSSQSAWSLLAGSVSQARVESHRIRHMVNRGQKVINASVARDHLYEVAGDIIVGLPERLTLLENLLDRTSYALSIMGEDFYRGRLSLDDKEMVDQAVKYSQSPFPSPRKVANRFLQRQAGVQKVERMIETALSQGKIDQNDYERIILNVDDFYAGYMDFSEKARGKKVKELERQIFDGPYNIPFKFTGGMIKMRVPQRGHRDGVKVRQNRINLISKVTLETHAYYRLLLRDITGDMIQKSLNGWNNAMHKGMNLNQIESKRNEINAQRFRDMGNDGFRRKHRWFHSDFTMVLRVLRRHDSTYEIIIETMWDGGDGNRDVREMGRRAYRQPASELPGASTFVNEDSKKNLTPNTSKGVNDNADSREKSGPQTTENKQQALPLKSEHSEKRDQKLPISQTDGQGTARPQFNTPPDSENAEGGRPIHKEKVRTRSMPGDEYGTPYKDDGYGLSRRTMKATISRLADLYLSERNER